MSWGKQVSMALHIGQSNTLLTRVKVVREQVEVALADSVEEANQNL